MLQHGADRIFGIVLFAGTVTPALTILPAFAAIIAGEVLRIRSWMFYVLAGGASLVAVPLLISSPRADDIQSLPASPYMSIFAAAGFVGGFVYWLLAGARA
jgi:predicted cobalt transporter CbtA